jgi:hypothetical protein
MSEGDNHTAKPIHAWEDEYVTKTKLNLYMSEGDNHTAKPAKVHASIYDSNRQRIVFFLRNNCENNVYLLLTYIGLALS